MEKYNYSVYMKGIYNKGLIWVKTFYSCNYKDERGAYKAANRYAKKLNIKGVLEYLVIKDED